MKNLFLKATYSAAIGFPISLGLNLVLQDYIKWSIVEYRGIIAAILIGIPYFVASQWRQFILDYIYEKYGIRLDPKHLLREAYHKWIGNE